MKVITFASFKGGSGKTTSAMATVSVLVDRGDQRICLLDLDKGQTSLATWLRATREVYGEDAPSPETLDLLPLDPALDDAGMANRIAGLLLEASNSFDICIIDTQGTKTHAAIAAFRFTDLVVIPVQISGIEVEPFVLTYSAAENGISFDGARVAGLATRMPNVASSTMLETREVLAAHNLVLIDGTTERDGYRQLNLQAGTFEMIRTKFVALRDGATDSKVRVRAEREIRKIEGARDDTIGMLERLGIIDAHEEEQT